jgi:acyl-CoA reductase-like NAD-dependent aldehyde dehydrogenase
MRPFFSNGRAVSTKTSEPVINPWTGACVDEVHTAGPEEVEEAVAAATAAFATTRRSPAHERSNVLSQAASLISGRSGEFVDTIVAEAGKPAAFARAEVDRAATTFRLAAAEALADGGHGIAMDASAPGVGHFGLVRRFPIGPVLGITPFNFPLNLVAHKVAPCIATGNTMVLKPAMKTPLTALLLGEVLAEAGAIPGQINTVPFGHHLVEGLLGDPRIAMVSFTGSVEVGWNLKALAPRKRFALELGGNAAVVVEPDCDWLAAVPAISSAAYGYAGQSCISVQRILVHHSILAPFRDALVHYIVNAIRAGDPSDPATTVGPMITAGARDGMAARIRDAVAAGASLLTPAATSGHSLLGPVLLEDVPAESPLLRDEAFAPVAVLQSYGSFDEALAMVNDSRFGLQAGIFTSSLRKALHAFESLEVGGVMVNQVPTFRVENMPYGGVKDSGMGREGVRHAMHEMTEPRSLVVRTA